MKLKNREMIAMQETLAVIGSKDGIDPVLGVQIARNNFELENMVRPVLDEKEKLIEKYGKKDRDGELIADEAGNIPLADGKKYREELKRLMDADGEVNLTLFTMGAIKMMAPTPNQILHLLPVIVEKEK